MCIFTTVEGIYSVCAHFTDGKTEVKGLTQASNLLCSRVRFSRLVSMCFLSIVYLFHSSSRVSAHFF